MNQKEIKEFRRLKSQAKTLMEENKKRKMMETAAYWQGRFHALDDILKTRKK